ncbi:hypothetical protein ABBQ32_005440 [Trebouxia sp. C0010 RCD-2024]
MNMKGARLFLLAISVFALCGWAVLLGGVAALEHDCNNLPGSLADYARANNNPEAASIFQGISNYNDQYNFGVAPRCARQFGLQWFLICIYVAIIIGSIACAFSHVAARHMALTWAFLLATVTALFWIFCQRYDTINWSLSNVDTPLWRALGGIKSALRCVLAGYIINSIASFLMFFGLVAVYNEANKVVASSPSWSGASGSPYKDPAAGSATTTSHVTTTV